MDKVKRRILFIRNGLLGSAGMIIMRLNFIKNVMLSDRNDSRNRIYR
jgi:hypothetical protein